jgi:hypothetical protein
MARIAVIAWVVIFTGCAVATWGGAYHVLNSTSDQIVIGYDRVLTNPSLLMPLVTEHCAKYGKQPYMVTYCWNWYNTVRLPLIRVR